MERNINYSAFGMVYDSARSGSPNYPIDQSTIAMLIF